jgi:hypothetical protein
VESSTHEETFANKHDATKSGKRTIMLRCWRKISNMLGNRPAVQNGKASVNTTIIMLCQPKRRNHLLLAKPTSNSNFVAQTRCNLGEQKKTTSIENILEKWRKGILIFLLSQEQFTSFRYICQCGRCHPMEDDRSNVQRTTKWQSDTHLSKKWETR